MNKLQKQLLFATFAFGAFLLPATALAVTKTPFTSMEKTWVTDPGKWVSDGKTLFITGQVISGTEAASDPRLSGSEIIGADAIMDLATGAMKYWGDYHLENADGAWDGYWFGDTATGTAVCTALGSGRYAGLVGRFTMAGPGLWTGYIVENGPGAVPMKLSGWRVEQFDWSVGAVVDPSNMQPTGESNVVGKVTLVNGAGVATHTGQTTDQAEVGILTFLSPTKVAFSLTGTMKSANGDLLYWVGTGTTDLQTGVANATVHWIGGTGRFEAATGFFVIKDRQVQDPKSTSTGTIRY